jgi:hypothetical protein
MNSRSIESRAGDHGPPSLPPGTEALGYGGLLPFAACTTALWVLDPGSLQQTALRALLAYGATILAFLGAVHWGFVLQRPGRDATVRLAIGVVPQLVAAATLLMAAETALVTQMIAFGALWLYEHRVLGPGLFGTAYLDLRRNLTLGVLGLQLAALLGPLQRMAGA